jgi:chromate reductase, NAD(P)H dehydrogenase (quinone)
MPAGVTCGADGGFSVWSPGMGSEGESYPPKGSYQREMTSEVLWCGKDSWMAEVIKILGIPGSLRKASYNRFLLRAAQELVPEGATIDIFELDDIPSFNQDEERNPPARIVSLKSMVRAADAILFATPEYNYSVPGVLKNAIDWASRPYGDSAWNEKPVAVMGASVGRIGTARAQYHLRQMFVFLNMHALSQPEVMVGNAAQRFDENGNLTDEQSANLIRQLLENLVTWTRRLQPDSSRLLRAS